MSGEERQPIIPSKKPKPFYDDEGRVVVPGRKQPILAGSRTTTPSLDHGYESSHAYHDEEERAVEDMYESGEGL